MLFSLRSPIRVPLSFPRTYPPPAASSSLSGKYDHVPVALARVQSGKRVMLRDYETQRALKCFDYDLRLQDGKVMPANGPN
ncbi:hypothetical protein B0H11DRAFT_2123678 [Mycena galericulata]|nr:hypothetical protein B0H11DRAFT_2123678 [Mycena galericulata]